MKEIIIQLITAFTGTIGFGFIFRVRLRLLLPSAAAGMLGWGLYLLAASRADGIVVPTFCASAFIALLSELFARTMKAPSTVFFAASIIPLIPGSTLYYTMRSAVLKDWEAFESFGLMTLQYALSIAAGMCLAWALCDLCRKLGKHGVRHCEKSVKKNMVPDTVKKV